MRNFLRHAAFILAFLSVDAFIVSNNPSQLSRTRSPYGVNKKNTLFQTQKDDKEVEVGSRKYYKGFISSPIEDSTVQERGSGLEQALKLGGSFAVVLALLFAGFMASNGLT
jgi:hypothetical protein